ncbi:MAG TPA: alpha-L-fucosidase, partial [Inquilinus sp.]
MIATFLPEEKKAWFVQDRFGMFIHWGLYALPARHEWVKSREEIGDDSYQAYFEHFDPDLYDPRDWAARARKAGMKYVVLTAKHHEGFCLWDSKVTDYKATNTP